MDHVALHKMLPITAQIQFSPLSHLLVVVKVTLKPLVVMVDQAEVEVVAQALVLVYLVEQVTLLQLVLHKELTVVTVVALVYLVEAAVALAKLDQHFLDQLVALVEMA